MRPARFFDWLDDVIDGPVARVLKTLFAAALLLALAGGVYWLVVDYRAEVAARNEQLQQGQ